MIYQTFQKNIFQILNRNYPTNAKSIPEQKFYINTTDYKKTFKKWQHNYETGLRSWSSCHGQVQIP